MKIVPTTSKQPGPTYRQRRKRLREPWEGGASRRLLSHSPANMSARVSQSPMQTESASVTTIAKPKSGPRGILSTTKVRKHMLKAVEKTIQTKTASIHSDQLEKADAITLRYWRRVKRDLWLGQVRINKESTRGLLARPMASGTGIIAWGCHFLLSGVSGSRWRLLSR